jgi:hypothetical protein
VTEGGEGCEGRKEDEEITEWGNNRERNKERNEKRDEERDEEMKEGKEGYYPCSTIGRRVDEESVHDDFRAHHLKFIQNLHS